MLVNGMHYRTIWPNEENDRIIHFIDQRFLPHKFVVESLSTTEQVATAIKDMHVRGAGLIGATAGYGMYIAAVEAMKTTKFDDYVKKAGERLKATRPTAVNLEWAVNRQIEAMKAGRSPQDKLEIARKTAKLIADEDAKCCKAIGEHGVRLIKEIADEKEKGETVNIMTHCNAGWLAFVDYGSATSPIYTAVEKGIDVFVWVSETRPRLQGANLTAWEMVQQGIKHKVITDNTAGHLMQHGLVDMVLVGSDRTTCTGDVANKIGTYQKAVAANDNDVPFFAALPSSTIDWKMRDGLVEIPIEERNQDEIRFVHGLCDGEMKKVMIMPEGSPAANFGFDVTPARLVTGLITERGICEANEKGIMELFPEKKEHATGKNKV
jgi:methylthioribose-1-phosphate isomerase